MIEKLKFLLKMVENIVGKEENTGYQHFLLFAQCFQKASKGRKKSGSCGKELNQTEKNNPGYHFRANK